MPPPVKHPPRKGITPPPPVGWCIYCGSTTPPLTKEHIIPESLGGNLTLRDSSCEVCRDITRRNEQKIAREVFQGIRAQLRMKIKEPPTHVLMRTGSEPDAASFRVETKDHPNFLFITVPEPPGILSNRDPNAPVAMKPFFLSFEDKAAELRRQSLGAPTKLYRDFDPLVMGRFLAKVGLGIALHHHGPTSIETDDIREIIVGPRPPYHLVGGTELENIDLIEPYAPISHRGTAYSIDLNGEFYAAVQFQLFCQLGLPVFTIVVGKFTQAGLNKVVMENQFRYT